MPTLEQESIASLKGQINRLEARLEYLYKHFGLTFVEESHPGDDPRVIAAIRSNNMLEAIKYYRIANNSSLEEAKNAIQEMRGRLGI